MAIKMCAFLVGFSQDVYIVSGFFLQSAVVSIGFYGNLITERCCIPLYV